MSKEHSFPRFAAFLPAWIWFLVVLVLICMPGDDLPPLGGWFHVLYFDKWVHFLLFGLLALLFMYPFRNWEAEGNRKKTTFVYISLALCAWGLATEFIQKYLVTGRSFDLTDWAADSVGITLAWIFACRYFLTNKFITGK